MLELFEEDIGQAIDYRPCGYLFLLTRPQDVAVFERNIALQQRLGVQTEWWSGDAIRKRLPMMALDDVLAGTFHAKDGLADPNSVVMGYIRRAQELGVQTFNEVEVTGIRVVGGKINAVQTSQGNISTQVVVNAAGPWAGVIGELAGVNIPITPIRRQMFTTTPMEEIPEDFPFVIDFTQSLYFHREGLGLLTGMSNPDEKPGFNQNVDLDWELVHLEAATTRLRALERAGLASRWAGLYEVTPDAHPIFGSTPVDNFYVCVGFSGHGFMHGPVSGKIISEIILEGHASTVDVSSLSLTRFSEGKLIQEYNVV
jgi:sarcosine oxidase subunit beta